MCIFVPIMYRAIAHITPKINPSSHGYRLSSFNPYSPLFVAVPPVKHKFMSAYPAYRQFSSLRTSIRHFLASACHSNFQASSLLDPA